MNEEQHLKQLPKDWKWVKLGFLNCRAGRCQKQVVSWNFFSWWYFKDSWV
jgi:hypothetical protein